jgi:hypothetical protein
MKTLHVAMVMLAAGIGCASSESGVSPAGGGGAGGASAGSSGAGGGCAHDCLGGECKDGQCQPLALLSDVCPAGTSAELALTEGDLYFDYSPMCEATCASVPLVRMPTSGGARTTISDHFIPGRLVARDIAVYFQLTQYGGHADNPDGCDFVNNGLFSSDDSSDTSMPLAPWGVAGDTVELTVGADQLYLLAKGPGITPGHIDVVPLQGGVVQTLIPNLSEQGVGLLLTNDVNLFWMSQNTDGSYDMLTAPIGGAPVETLVTSAQVDGRDVDLLGVDGSAVYYGAWDPVVDTRTLYRLPMGEDPPGTRLHEFPAGSGPDVIASSGDDICFRIFAAGLPDTVGCMPASGGALRVIAAPGTEVKSLQADAAALYWWGDDRMDPHPQYSLYKVAK